ncbi:MAG: hypothetical protein VYA55_20710 [Pseudomonadota bacterium]|nr:hypothetical protein [Pseudomonadota bacterium]
MNDALQFITDFETHYAYDAGFMRDMLHHTPNAFDLFQQFLPMARHRELLTVNDYWVAKIAAMMVEDCGACLQLNVRMAREQEVSVDLVKAALAGGADLPEPLHQLFQYAQQVAGQGVVDSDLMAQMRSRYSKGQLLELGLCVASAKVFPTIKRALDEKLSCALIQVEID